MTSTLASARLARATFQRVSAALPLLALSCSSSPDRPKAVETVGPTGADASTAVDASNAAVADAAPAGEAEASNPREAGASFVATALTMGLHHTCALTAEGGVRCWGDNTYGQLGDGTTIARLTSVGVTGLSAGVTAIAAGDNHTCALTGAGAITCWGNNASGELGNASSAAQVTTPTPVPSLASGVAAIAAGGADTCAAMGDGGSMCWGNNVSGQVGDGTNENRSTPSATKGADGVVATGTALAPAGDHTCLVATAGSVVCAGDDTNGELGNGQNASTNTYVASGISDGATAVVSSLGVTCALGSDGTVSCWGFGGEGELGNGSMDPINLPGPVTGLTGVTGLAAGVGHACAVGPAGGLMCWGDNSGGAIGDGTTTARPTPVAVPGIAAVAAVAAGTGTCAITTSGAVRCWGPNADGEVGDGTTAERDAPAATAGFP